MAKVAKISEISAPAIGAAIKPQTTLWQRLATTAAVNAAESS